MGGRERSAGWPICWPPIWTSTPQTSTWCSVSGAPSTMARSAGPQGSGSVQSRRRRAVSKRSGSWRPGPVDSMPEADRGARRNPRLPLRRRLRHERGDRTRLSRPTCGSRRHGWGEKNGTVTNSERRISRQRPFLPAPGEARPDWWIITQVARRMGFGDAFAFENASEILPNTSHCRRSRTGSRDFDLSSA